MKSLTITAWLTLPSLLLAGGLAVRMDTPLGGESARQHDSETAAEESGTAQATLAIPPRALIPGVPYISWREAEKVKFDRALANPSVAASLGMILRYWGRDLDLLEQAGAAMPKGPEGWATVELRTGLSVEELKPLIADGTPVLVSTALTPFAHPLIATGNFLRMMNVPHDADHRTSGSLGDMASIESYGELARLYKLGLGLSEGAIFAARVAIGYDNARKVIILHDPSFGPAWEVGFEDFERMWQLSKKSYAIIRPPDSRERLTSRLAGNPPAAPYPAQGSDQQAAVEYAFGYALVTVGRGREAEQRFRAGLRIPGLGKGYEHLFLLELALRHLAEGEPEAARTQAEKAAELVPEDYRPWLILSGACRGDIEEDQQTAAQAKGRARALCSDPAAEKALAAALPRDMAVFGCRLPLPPPAATYNSRQP